MSATTGDRWLDETFVVNLDRATDRWAHISTLAHRAGLKQLSRISATDGATLTADAIASLQAAGVLAPSLDRFHPRARLAEIGCALSHRRALEAVIASGCDTALILEDDVALAGDPADWPLRAAAALRDLPADWDLWLLYRCFDIEHRVTRLTPRTVIPWSPQGAAAYAVTAAGARRLLAALTPLDRPVDAQYMQAIRDGAVRAFAASPLLIDPGQFPSLINTDGVERAWVREGINRPPEYWPERYLAHLGESAPAPGWIGALRRSVHAVRRWLAPKGSA